MVDIKGLDKDSENAGENTDNGKTKKDKQVKDTVGRALDVLLGEPTEISITASMMLVSVLTDALAIQAAWSALLKSKRGSFMQFDIRAGEKKERDIVPTPFPWDLSSMSRQG